MLNYSSIKYFQIALFLVGIAYLFVDIPYAIEILWLCSIVLSLNVLVSSIRFRIRRNHLIELGELERFHHGFVGFIVLIVIIALFGYFGPKISGLDIFPVREEKINPSFMTITLLPQLVRFVVGIAFKEMGDYLYITNRGILFSMNTKENFIWDDFTSYKILPDMQLLRFRKKKEPKEKFFFVSYHEDYFKEHREEILSILDKNLKSEHE